jgi:hypothetical protein
MGTILVELVLRVPFLSGDSDADQLKKTFHALGTPTEEDWPVSNMTKLESLLMVRVIHRCQTTTLLETTQRRSGHNTSLLSAKTGRI